MPMPLPAILSSSPHSCGAPPTARSTAFALMPMTLVLPSCEGGEWRGREDGDEEEPGHGQGHGQRHGSVGVANSIDNCVDEPRIPRMVIKHPPQLSARGSRVVVIACDFS